MIIDGLDEPVRVAEKDVVVEEEEEQPEFTMEDVPKELDSTSIIIEVIH